MKRLFRFARAADRQNSLELEQAVIRTILGAFLSTYGFYLHFTGWMGGLPESGFYVIVSNLFGSFCLLLANLVSLKSSKSSRYLGITLDISACTALLIVGGIGVAALYGIYLWVCIANGLRFGRPYLRYANVLSVVSFSAVIVFSEFWSQQIVFGFGLLLWLVLLPLYVEKLLCKLEAAIDRANSANIAKSQFLANMSHEIRTPLTAIIGFSEASLDQDQTDDERKAALSTIVQSGNHLLTIINDILDFSKIEANKLEVEHIHFDLYQLVEDVKSLINEKMISKGLKFEIEYRFPLPRAINSDPVKIKQVLINLCSNAVKFTHQGQVKITVDYLQNSQQIEFAVIDTGIGMSNEQLEKIFKPFEQADTTTTRQFGGTGLGLTLSKQFTEMLGGNLTVTSVPGKGSRFSATIAIGPIDAISFINSPGEVKQPHQLQRVKTTTKRFYGEVLVAEDNENNQKLFSLFLKKMGLNVTIAQNGKVAVELANQNTYDLIYMDMQMPIMSGLEAVRILRNEGNATPIVALTANATKSDKIACLDAGCDDFLGKPVLRDQLVDMTSQYLYPAIECRETSEPGAPLPSALLKEEPEFIDLVEKFVAELPGTIDKLHSSFRSHDWKQLQHDIHILKGAGGGFGYPQLTKLAANIEIQLREQYFSGIKITLQELGELCERIYQGLPINKKSA